MGDIHEILKKYWGFDKFRPLQEEIIQSVLQGHDTLALLPTGGGKSLCFQIPAMAMEGICIVISPLIALMKDQVEQLHRRGINAIAIFSGMNLREIDIALDNCVYGKVKFLYVSPERLKTEIFIERLKRMKVNLLAIDEAHCISQWGYDFRPSYLEIAEIKKYLPDTKKIALTASATLLVQGDILEKLEFKEAKVFKKSFSRDNLSYSCFLEEDKERRLLNMLKKVSGSGIIYVRSRKRTKEIADMLRKNQVPAEYYHAGLSNQLRSTKQEAWIKNQVRFMVATNAFGMGIDKPDVRMVIHWDIPDSIEAYYQEAGRAGRDEKKAYAVILYQQNDMEELKKRITQEYPPEDFLRRVYQALANYFKIAVGSSNMVSFDFDLKDFQSTFKLPSIETWYAIKKLEEEGFIQLNESFFNPSRVLFAIDHNKLYEYQIANPDHDKLIKIMLRMYGGEIYSNFVQINEKDIAVNLGVDQPSVLKYLALMQQKELIIYDKQKDKPQITFTTSRFDSSKLPLDIKRMEMRKKKDTDKMNAVLTYLSDKKCRTLKILEYFDEENGKSCGICDNCILQKKVEKNVYFYNKYRETVLACLGEGNMNIRDLVKKTGILKENDLLICIKIMVSSGEIQYLANGEMSLY